MAVTEFKLPDIGEGVAEGEITSWKVKAGEDVVEDQVMVEVMTDKATVEIGSPVTGKIVELKAGEGDVVPVGEVIVVLEEGVPSVEAADEAPPVEEPAAPKEPAPPPAVSQELDLFTDEPPVQREAPPPPPPPPPPATVVVPEEAPPAVEEPIEEAPSSDLGEVHFTLPDVGEGVAEGEITKWIVSEGDAVVEDQPMLEVMTDKATVEIGSPVNGRVQEILRKEGETVPVGDVLLVLAADGEGPATQDDVGDSESVPQELEQDNSPVVATASRSAPEQRASGAVARRVRAAPAVRRLAREMELEIGLLEGSGPQGRVTMDDVRAASVATTAVAEPTVVQPQSAEVEPAPAPPQESPAAPSEPDLSEKSEEATKPVVALSVDGPRPHDLPGDRREPLRGLRRRIANSMRTARRVAAHFTYCEEIDVTELILLREAAKKRVLKKTGTKLSYMPFLVKAILPALEEFPLLNASLDEETEEVVFHSMKNVGIAVDTPPGLVVPVVHDADKKTVVELNTEITEMAERARAGKTRQEDLGGGTFTISNAGNIGGVMATPIINVPEVAILGVHAMRPRPWVVDDEIVIRDIMWLSLSLDHRVVDGGVGAHAMNRIKELIENPALLLLEED